MPTRLISDFELKHTIYGYKMEQLIYWIPRKYKLLWHKHAVVEIFSHRASWCRQANLLSWLFVKLRKERVSLQINRQGHLYKGRTPLPFNLLKTVNTTAHHLAMKTIYFETQTWSWNHWCSEVNSWMQNLDVKLLLFSRWRLIS